MAEPTRPVRAALIGCGNMSGHHLRRILPHFDETHFIVTCEPSPDAFTETAALLKESGRALPPNQPDLERLLEDYADQLDVAFIVTPHKFHFEQARLCLQAGLDVLLEKPMVMTAEEAERLIEIRDQSGRVLVVAFQGSLSPQVRMADRLIRSGAIGKLRTIDGQTWQNWGSQTESTWRQQPDIAGGGFFFDTGAHLMNTVSDLAGEPFVEIAAWLDYQGGPVDINGIVMGRLRSGALVTLNACGDAYPTCDSEIRIIGTKGMLRTGMWGSYLDVKYSGGGGWSPVPVSPSLGVWEQFLAVRQGEIPNPSPAEVGLRMARLWDAIRLSAAQNGQPVKLA